MKYATQTKHGLRKTRFYRIYSAAKTRCENPNSSNYKNYGGRGIKFNFKDFAEFQNALYEDYLAHSRLHGEQNTTIDRINTDGDYEPSNCRWATMAVQARTRRSTVNPDGLAGVKKSKNKWMARRSINGTQVYLGLFNTPELAHKAYIRAI